MIDAVRLRSQSGMPRCACARPLFHECRPVRCRAELRLLLERALRRVGAERAELNLGALLAPPCLRPRLGPSPRLGVSVPPVDGSATGLQVLRKGALSRRCSFASGRIRCRTRRLTNPSVSEVEATMAGILVSMSVAMSWSGFVALVHDHRELQGSFAVSLRTPKAPLRVVRAERHLVGLEEHRA